MTTQQILQGVHDWTNGKIVYDISVAHPDGQGNPTPYADLTAALGNGGANIPEPLRKGGMSVKFIKGSAQSSDNKYVQYRLMAQNFTTDVTQWQGIDGEPVAGSENLVKSGGVFPTINAVNKSLIPINGKVSIIGDSISTFTGTMPSGYVTYYPQQSLGVTSLYDMWWHLLLSMTDSKLEVNASWSGSRVTTRDEIPDFYDRTNLLGSPDYIFVELGTNDNSVPLGDYDYDSENLSESEFIPAYIKGVKALKTNYPNAKIVLFVFQMADSYASAIKNIGKHYELDVIDVRSYYVNNVHPNKLQMCIVAQTISSFYIKGKVDVQNELALGAVYDVSAKNPTAGTNNDGKFESLSALLSDANFNTLIPTSVRKGGMSIKFANPENKYVQYRYMLQYENNTAGRDAFVNTKNWQGIDNEPLIESDNLINSDSIARADFGITGTINFKRVFNGGGINFNNSSIEIPLKSGVMYPIILNNESEIDNVFVYYINNDNTKTSAKSITKGEQTTIIPPEDKKGIALYKPSTGYKLVSISLTNPNSLKEYIESSDNVPTEGSDSLVKSGGVYKELYGYNETYNFTHTTENGTFNFHIPAGNYTVSSNYTDLYSGLSLYFKDAEGNVIISDPISVFINNGLQLNQDVEKIQLYGSISTQGILSIVFKDSEHTGGIKDDLNELQNDVSYLSSGLSLQKDILLNEEQITVTGTGQYVNKTILTLEGNEIDNNCWYYFEADSFSGSQSAAPLTIIATINGVRTTVANSRVNPDALCFYNTNGNSVTKLEFFLYPLSSGAVFNGVRIYKMVDAVPCNVLNNVATSVVQKEALSRVVPSTTCRTIAHRGWNATAPKCMLSAVLEAKKNLCSIVENDVFNSKDEQLVMWHDTTLAYLRQIQDINGYILYLDPTLMGELTSEYGDELYYNITSPLYWLNPTTNELYTWDGSQYVASSVDIATLSIPDVSHLSVKSFNLADLKRFDFGIWKNVKYKGETIPTFEEWVSYCKCIGVDIYIDKKLSDTLMAEKIEEMVTIVRRHGMLRHATWLGFYPEVRMYDPKARCIILTAPTPQSVNNEDLLQALEDGGEYSIIFEPEITQLTAENAALALDKGFGLEAYYVEFFPYNTPKRTIFQNMINAINIGCQGLTMDYYTVEDAIYGKYLK